MKYLVVIILKHDHTCIIRGFVLQSILSIHSLRFKFFILIFLFGDSYQFTCSNTKYSFFVIDVNIERNLRLNTYWSSSGYHSLTYKGYVFDYFDISYCSFVLYRCFTNFYRDWAHGDEMRVTHLINSYIHDATNPSPISNSVLLPITLSVHPGLQHLV